MTRQLPSACEPANTAVPNPRRGLTRRALCLGLFTFPLNDSLCGIVADKRACLRMQWRGSHHTMHAYTSHRSIDTFAAWSSRLASYGAGGHGGDADFDPASTLRRQPPRRPRAPGVAFHLIWCVRAVSPPVTLVEGSISISWLNSIPCTTSFLTYHPVSTGSGDTGVQARPTSGHGNASVRFGGKDIRQMRTSHTSPLYIPLHGQHCRQCATCKQQRAGDNSMSMTPKCRAVCKKCPNDVVLSAERALSIEVDGVVVTEYVSAGPTGAQGHRALQSTDSGDGLVSVQRATTIFEGSLSYVIQNPCGTSLDCISCACMCVLRLRPCLRGNGNTFHKTGPVAFAGGEIPPVSSLILPVSHVNDETMACGRCPTWF